MTELFRNRHFIVHRVPASPMIEVKRTAEKFDTIEEMRRSIGELTAVLDAAGRLSSTLLVDSRDAPPRNDPAFEAVFEPLRVSIGSGFMRVAVLVRTTSGKLQVDRHSKIDGLNVRSFVNEDAARAYCIRSK